MIQGMKTAFISIVGFGRAHLHHHWH